MMKNLSSAVKSYFGFAFLVFAFFPIFFGLIFAQPTAPILRIETGMHTDGIEQISVDSDGKLMATVSGDRTARIWDLQNGRLLRVLRVPIDGDEGKLYSVAMSPNGKTVAVGGFTPNAAYNAAQVYLFDIENSKVIKTIDVTTFSITRLAFSPNGQFLVAASARKGIRVYQTNDWKQIGIDEDYEIQSLGVDFDVKSRRIITSCLDGNLRLYEINENGLKLLAKKIAPGGKKPHSVKFSPDNSKIAVGFLDSNNINVLSATDLSLLFTPDKNDGDVRDNESATFNSVAWSSDGKFLYAGGAFQLIGTFPIKYWHDGGKYSSIFEKTLVANNTISDICPLPNGIVFSTFEPSWGIINQRDYLIRIPSNNADFRSRKENFLISNDGSEVAFGYESNRDVPANFSLSLRRLEAGEIKNQDLKPPRLSGLDIADWKGNSEPKLNGNKLDLGELERSTNLAISPDASKFLLGTNYKIRMFDRLGKKLWETDAHGLTAAVNISGDGKLAVIAHGDGTIRWYRISDGKELLAFFPHNDQKRWILWTPSGYYDVSSDGESLIGWHVNNGKDKAADFFPVGLFRERFYRPDVVSKILYTLDEATALRIANEESGRKEQQSNIANQLPPVVEILSPKDGTEVSNNKVTIRYNVRSNSSVTNVKALIDGRPTERGVGSPSSSSEITVTIPEKDCEISLIAENQFAPSVPAIIRIKWKGRTSGITNEDLKPKLYILAVGVSKYANSGFNLGFASKDAKDFVNVMLKQKGGLYRDVEVKLLTDGQATSDNILDGLDWITRATTARDVAMVFFAGHGINDNLNRFYFAPHNFNPDSLLRTGIKSSDIKSAVESIAGKAVFFVDSCHAGNSLGTVKRRDGAVDINGFVNELSSAENGAIVFNASTGKQVSLEDAAWNNGAFTKALVEGLSGKAATKDGKITIKSLDLYISERVKELTNGRQTPTTGIPNTVPDFPIAARLN